MKVNIFKKLIREVVREELDYKFSALEKKLDEVLVSSNSNSIVEDRAPQPVSSQPKKRERLAAPPQSTAAQPLTRDSILNDILNETAQSGEWKNIEKEAQVQSVTDNTEGLPDFLSNAINKDYSQVMKKIEEKAKFNRGA